MLKFSKASLAASFNGQYIELNRKLESDGLLELITEKDKRSIDILNHSTAHLMAQAIIALYPNAKFGVGPAIERGFITMLILAKML